MIQPATLNFLKKLKKNNNKIWFDEHKAEYQIARADFEAFVQKLLEKMVGFDDSMQGLTAKNCMFRINRDVRFSHDKTPYKINMGASLNKGGKKSIYGGYYFHMQPGGNSFMGGGLWMPEAIELKKLRQEIDYNFPEFKKIISNPTFKKHFGELEREKGHVLVNIPKGYDKENPAGHYLKLKSFVATQYIPDEVLTKPALSNEVIKNFKALYPFIQFINRSFE